MINESYKWLLIYFEYFSDEDQGWEKYVNKLIHEELFILSCCYELYQLYFNCRNKKYFILKFLLFLSLKKFGYKPQHLRKWEKTSSFSNMNLFSQVWSQTSYSSLSEADLWRFPLPYLPKCPLGGIIQYYKRMG